MRLFIWVSLGTLSAILAAGLGSSSMSRDNKTVVEALLGPNAMSPFLPVVEPFSLRDTVAFTVG